MNYTYNHYQIGLTLLNGIGPKRAKLLLNCFDTIEHLFQSSFNEFHSLSGLSRKMYDSLELKSALENASKIIEENDRLGIKSIFWEDDEYPRRLKQCDDAPMVLYSKGKHNYNSGKFVAVVGTRDLSTYGKTLATRLIEDLKELDITIVSGLAVGIDTIAHSAAIDNKLQTIAVLGHGLDKVYPAVNKKLARSIEENGSLLTEFIPWSIPDRENFPMRNRIVAGLCDATIVIESRSRGGSLITAELANDYNRDVFAFPGNVNSERSKGCNRLIQNQKAHLINDSKDFLRMMNWENAKNSVKKPQPPLFISLNEKQEKIVSVLKEFDALEIDVISYKSNLSASQINIELLHLEMSGVIKSSPGKKYSLQ